MRSAYPACFILPHPVATALLALGAQPALAATWDALPAAPRSVGNNVPTRYTLYLTLVVNGRSDDRLVPVSVSDGHYRVEAGALQRNAVRLKAGQSGLVELSQLDAVTTRYDGARQRLELTVPDAWLPQQTLGGPALLSYRQAESGTGLLFSYDSYSLRSSSGQRYTANWLEQRLFSSAGIISNSGTWRLNGAGAQNSGVDDGYLRYDTSWKYNDEQNLIAWQAGDVINNSLTWSNATRLGGIRVARNFSVRPDLVTYPLINWSGTAALPGSVDLFINGYKASSNSVNAGPFTLTNVPYINGAGEATVVTTDALGRQVSTSVPFYVSNQLLRTGLSDFDFTAGALRQNYGLRSADYGNAAASGIWRYGLNDAFTLSLHGEGRGGLALGGIGSDLALGRWGTLSSAWSQSHSDAAGRQWVAGYSYYASRFSLNAQHLQRSSGYNDITSWQSTTQLSRQADQATFSITPFGSGSGTVGLGWFDIRAADNSRTRLLNLSWSRGLWGASSLYLALNKTLGEAGYSAQLQFTLPLDSAGNLSASAQRSASGGYSERLSYGRNAPVSGGPGWNLAWGTGTSDYRQADLSWKTPWATLSGGLYGESGSSSQWAEASGSLVWMDSALFATNKINDAFVLVSTDGYPDVPVRFENQLSGQTDGRGHLLIPWVSAWYPSKVAIDTLDLPPDVAVPQNERRVAVRAGSGTLVTFPLRKVRSADLTLLDARQQPLPPGTPVREILSGQASVVGFAGKTWFSQLGPQATVEVQMAQGRCLLPLDLTTAAHGLPLSTTLTCSPPPPSEPH